LIRLLQQLNRPFQHAGGPSPHPAYGAYLYGVIIAGLASLTFSLAQIPGSGIGYHWLILASLTVLTSTYSIKIPAINSKISIGDTLYFTNVLLYGTSVGAVTAALDGLVGSIRARTRTRRRYYMLFNMAAMAYSAHIAGSLFYSMVPKGRLWYESGNSVIGAFLPLGVLAFSHYIVNSGSVAIIVALERRKNPFAVWKDSFLWSSITYFAGTAAAAFIAITIGAITPQVLGVIVPVLLAVYFTYKTYFEKVDEVRSLAYHDSLTGLPNRILFREQLEEALEWSERKSRMLAVMFLDVDHFKLINDTYGHGIGDLLLRNVASRLAATVRGSIGNRHPVGDNQAILIGRFGGDEFNILMKEIAHPEDAAVVARRFLQVLSNPYSLNGQEVTVSATIGISVYPFDGADAETLLRNADAALYYAKENGRNNFRLYSRSMNEKSSDKLSLESDLRKALDQGEFEIHYQPTLDAQSLRVSGAEALIRWRHPARGLLRAAEFISLAEETGLIKPIGEWVLRAVCAQIGAWIRDGLNAVPISVNLSPLQFRQDKLAGMVAGILQEAFLNQAYLELELTESTIMENEQAAEISLAELRALGVRILIDDFGTGYSSLSRLKRFRPDALKIDRSFVAGCAENPDDRAIIAATIAMAHSLGLRVVAEGVESRQQLCFLRELGCDSIQGFYFCRPIPSGEFAMLLNGNSCLKPVEQKEGLIPSPLNMGAETFPDHPIGGFFEGGMR
jgi:diguanylate cyclase (GGDEF)-like protein